MFSWPNNDLEAVLPMIALLASIAQLVMACGVRWVGGGLNLVEEGAYIHGASVKDPLQMD